MIEKTMEIIGKDWFDKYIDEKDTVNNYIRLN